MASDAPQLAALARQEMARRRAAQRERAETAGQRQRDLADLQLDDALADYRRARTGATQRSRARARLAAQGQAPATGSGAALLAGADADRARAGALGDRRRRNQRLDLQGRAFQARQPRAGGALQRFLERLRPGGQRSRRLTS